MQSAEKTINGKKGLAAWSDLGEIVVKTVFALIIGFVYLIPAIIVFLLGIGAAALNLVSGFSPDKIFSAIATAGPLVLIALVLAIAASYLTPMALMLFLKSGKIGSAFDFGGVFKKAFTGKFLAAWLVSVILSVILGFISASLSWVFVLGWIITGFLAYVIQVSVFTIYAETFKELK